MARQRIVTGATALLAAAALGLAGCGAAQSGVDAAQSGVGAAGESAVEVAAAMGVDGQALAALGVDPADLDVDPVAAPAPSASGTPEAGPKRKGDRAQEWRKRGRARVLLRKNTLHGEVVVQTKEKGTKTVAVQRGAVTAIDATSVTVKSTDGFTMTWTFDEKLRVVERRATIRSTDVKVGTTVGVAGTKEGDKGVARLIVVPLKQK
ncbi:hypothetical protein O7602_29965 [Micromonospora sp. WMMD1128]|uniref:hypothetical protein n=1 Tax=unclassified Micromonospora TaxID=2617518 RepID=UPI00248CF68B|nr:MULTISPECIES: hypothetical protein [unclassified Micromonospora]WBB73829.1 hypothetical protein O7602_29965 [Micromonospora sp. WMMD1128]WFE32766.1 hypothetical protein O7613_24950 [Micromonospora sp. WMMD975]